MKTTLIFCILGIVIPTAVVSSQDFCGLSQQEREDYWECVERGMSADELNQAKLFLECINKQSAVELLAFFCNADSIEDSIEKEEFRLLFAECLKSHPASFNAGNESCLKEARK
uniref:Venom protein 184 n=1 Tax=Lychas mucronatus TaxID=172552 RepID=VP184_LYCMC|nr:RecName: Full=Venom protein 184; Flags: Precursor [Lychas mucronatus]